MNLVRDLTLMINDDANTEIENELIYGRDLNLATTALNYERFIFLAQNKNISQNERIGFPDSYRQGFEEAICNDIIRKFDNILHQNGYILDIGCGASPLTYMLLTIFKKHKLNVTLVDSAAMLDHINDEDNVHKIVGLFPKNSNKIKETFPNGYDYILCYSVLHYIFVDANIFDFIDSVIDLLKPGGMALIGDIPNISKRKRFFSSDAGKIFHKKFTQTTEDPIVDHFKIEFNQIDDSVIFGMMQRAQRHGCDAYLIPQPNNLPMHNRRDDLLIRKP